MIRTITSNGAAARLRPFATRTAAVIALLFAWSCAQCAIACTCPVWSDANALNLAHSGVGSPYKWGGACWSTADRTWGGADCSGYVVKAWQVPRLSSIKEQYHPYGTWHLFNNTTHWYAIGRASAWPSDLAGYPDPDGSGSATGHVVMYAHGDPYGLSCVYEAPGSGLRIRRCWKDLSASRWRFRRRHNMIRRLQMA